MGGAGAFILGPTIAIAYAAQTGKQGWLLQEEYILLLSITCSHLLSTWFVQSLCQIARFIFKIS